MKIGSTPDITSTSASDSAQVRGAKHAQHAHPAKAVGGTDQLDLSAAGAQASALSSASGDFDSAKVDAIRQAIRDGKFTINPGAIADRLISDAKSLLGPSASKP